MAQDSINTIETGPGPNLSPVWPPPLRKFEWWQKRWRWVWKNEGYIDIKERRRRATRSGFRRVVYDGELFAIGKG